MRCILGIDAGGSKCDAVLAGDDGQVLGWGRNDPGAAAAMGAEQARGVGRSAQAVSSAIRKAIGAVVCSDLHVAGLDLKLRTLLPAEGVQQAVTHHKAAEFDAALLLAGETCGVVALAGTGAFVAARPRVGRTVLLDSLGPMMGDRGGGFQIGLAALRAAARSTWHQRHATSLAGVLSRFRKRTDGDPYNPVGYMHEEHDRSEIASYARIVNNEADRGDRIALEIMRAAAEELASTAFDLAARLDIANDEYPLVGVGGVIMNSNVYWAHFCDRVHRFAPRWRPGRAGMPAVLGYVLLAAKGMPGVDYDSFRTRLLRSACDRLAGKEGSSP